MFLQTIRFLRHGPLAFLNPLWIGAGKSFRYMVQKYRYNIPINQKIGPYGPFKLHPHFAFSNYATWGNAHNKGFVSCIESCPTGRCFFDIGAHIGLVSLPAASMMKDSGHVYAFEPAKKNFEFLSYHANVNSAHNLHLYNLLVGDEEREQTVFYEDQTDNGMNSLVSLNNQGKGCFEKVVRQQITLDAFCQKNHLSPDLIKIDVEGAEILVLKGAIEVLKGCKPTVFLSLHPEHLRKLGHSVEELLELAEAIGYEITTFDGHPAKEYRLDEYLMKPKS